ncbi:hypothetical protein JCM6882_009196 [Rhodosporidiobolus microsporus]
MPPLSPHALAQPLQTRTTAAVMSSPEPGPAAIPKLTQDVQPDSCIKILVATDNHVGYAEKDPVRGQDSINTFKEILDLAVANDVDMLLLAGDLFHENRPSRTSLYQTISALRERCLGDRPVSLELVSDAGIGIPRDATWPGVNYEDYNINVGLPVFSIHGNHDDPQGVGAEGALCALDILSASGLINYFGRMELPGQATDDAEALEDGLKVKPVLLQKGDTKIALYGMGNIRDDRFMFELTNRRINMYRPAEDAEEWFNIVLVHQNRVAHGPNNSVPDEAFGEEANLVIWGHEHDCISEARPVPVTGRPYYISQPGSSIATSLAKGEAIPKHVGLLKIQGKEFEFSPLRLRSVRPFVFEEISLMEHHERQEEDKKKLHSKVAVNKFLKAKVNELIKRANAEWDELNPGKEDERLLPLIRLRVDYSGGPSGDSQFEIGNPQRFGQDFIDKVANPRDIVQFHRKAATRKQKVTINEPDLKDLDAALAEATEQGEDNSKVTVASLVHNYLDAQNLNVLSESLIQNAVEEFVGKGDKDAVGNWVKKLLKETRNEILKKGYEPHKEGPEYDNLDDEMQAAKKAAEAKYGGKGKGKARADSDEDTASEDDDASGSGSGSRSKSKKKAPAKGKGKAKAREPDSMDDDSDVSMASSSAGKKKKAPAKKAPAKKTVAKGKGKGKAALFNDSDEEEESEEEEVPKKKAPAKKAPAKKVVASTSTRKTPARSSATASKKKAETLTIDTDESSQDSSAEDEVPKKRKR